MASCSASPPCRTSGWSIFYVDPSAWRSGAGSLLLDHAKQRRPNGLKLWTFQRNALARAFYRGHGFVDVRETDGSANEEREPDVMLEWKV